MPASATLRYNAMKIGIFGGSFNPVHNGHIALARRAKEVFELDKVVFMPAGNPYQKSKTLPIEVRKEILRVALKDEFEISDLESDETKKTYSADTFEYLHKKYPMDTFYFILGYDCLENFASWVDPGRILANCEIIAASRDGASTEELQKTADSITARFGGKINIMEFPDIHISSTMIRNRANGGASLIGFLPKEAADLIVSREYYR